MILFSMMPRHIVSITSAGFAGESVLLYAAFSAEPAFCYLGDQVPEM